MLVFPRHVGCPFAERDVHSLVHLVLANPDRFSLTPPASTITTDAAPAAAAEVPVTFLIVTHSDLTSSRAWFASVLEAAFASFTPLSAASAPSSDLIARHFSLFPDPSGTLSKAYGIGQLGSYGALFSDGMWAEIKKLKEGTAGEAEGEKKKAGIVNRTTGGGSDRWKAHGACVVGWEGEVKWWWRGERAEEEGDWEAAVKSLGI